MFTLTGAQQPCKGMTLRASRSHYIGEDNKAQVLSGLNIYRFGNWILSVPRNTEDALMPIDLKETALTTVVMVYTE